MSVKEVRALSTSDPAKFMLGAASANRLAAMTGLPAEKLRDRSLQAISDEFRFHIDPMLLFFRKICGKVVKTDPVTHVDQPVPFATVQVEDTDCSFLGFFPVNSPWSWLFPFHCHREVIATTRTDECGNFCVWVPRFDIDWILRFRRERHCYPIIFQRPTLGDILKGIDPQATLPFPWKKPDPDPGPLAVLNRARLASQIATSFGPGVAARLDRLQTTAKFGAMIGEATAALDAPADLSFLQPPLGAELQPMAKPAAKGRGPAVAATLAARLGVEVEGLKGLDLRHYAGPFWRCYDVFVPEWVPILDVPDITFRVLQDTNGDGVEEQIYGESYFVVRWDDTSSAPVTLHAGPNALSSNLCGQPLIPCGNVPAIVMAGRLPVTGDPLVYDGTLGDASAGYARRTNRPHPSGAFSEALPLPEGQAPLAGVLSLFGCNKTDPKATHYRLVYRFSSNAGASFTTATPFLNMPHSLFRLNGVGVGEWHSAVPDSMGWYPIALPPGPNPWLPQDLLIDWPSQSLASGLYGVTLQLGTGGANVTSSSAEVAFVVDNTAPTGPMTVEVGPSAAGPFTPIDDICPVVRRGVIPQDRYFRVTLHAAARHLRSTQLWASGCGGGAFTFVSGVGGHQAVPGSTLYQHWHDSVTDNDQVLQVIYQLAAGTLEGTYSFGAIVSGRAFSPNDGAGYTAVPPWAYDPDLVHIYPSVAFSVFNAAP
ncbi:hypothetical protein GC209_17920 [bacterium]|nr:hypothetical protein [bacterium]